MTERYWVIRPQTSENDKNVFGPFYLFSEADHVASMWHPRAVIARELQSPDFLFVIQRLWGGEKVIGVYHTLQEAKLAAYRELRTVGMDDLMLHWGHAYLAFDSEQPESLVWGVMADGTLMFKVTGWAAHCDAGHTETEQPTGE
ncbi:MAG: hypothetical protein JRN42_08170 [Nitrososphaerota archaeon]|nr:hypothetical protein [Nitrososphaerota archaeon]